MITYVTTAPLPAALAQLKVLSMEGSESFAHCSMPMSFSYMPSYSPLVTTLVLTVAAEAASLALNLKQSARTLN